ncbi:MAG: GTP cyclohydrolase I, partial [Duncaniella sp.]|nr:GTP cyclohydrolase I [Duncaniella sp.]
MINPAHQSLKSKIIVTELSQETIKAIADHYEAIIRLLGEDVTREGLVKTPMRAAKALAYITRGYR